MNYKNQMTNHKNRITNHKYQITNYKFTCSRCQACYVGQTTRHLKTRSDEHRTRKTQPVAKKHMKECNGIISGENFEILGSSSRGEVYLMTLEALWVKELKPGINTKHEYKSRELTIRL